jgi:protein-S-isoprenylcysteine O-methyltransferase Ste14
MSASGRGPGVDVPPPLFFGAAFFIGWLLDMYVVHLWPPMTPKVARGVDLLGWTLVITGMSLTYWGLSTFWRRRTPVYPNRDAKLLVIEGPYRISRNPMYTGIIMACVGGSAIVGSLWPLLLLPFAIATVYFYVIRREERHLTEAFGDEYREYQRQVGRWLTF